MKKRTEQRCREGKYGEFIFYSCLSQPFQQYNDCNFKNNLFEGFTFENTPTSTAHILS